jgi:hypothetical protein
MECESVKHYRHKERDKLGHKGLESQSLLTTSVIAVNMEKERKGNMLPMFERCLTWFE